MSLRKNKEERRRYRQLKRDRFDGEWYREQNKDVDFSKISHEKHYTDIGWKEGWNPFNHFSAFWYLSEHPEGESLGHNPILNYEWQRNVPSHI